MNSSQWRDVNEGLYGAHGGFEIALAPVMVGLLGLWVDRMAGTTPLFVILFSIGGLIGAICGVYYRFRHAMAEATERRRVAEADLAAVAAFGPTTVHVTAGPSGADHAGSPS